MYYVAIDVEASGQSVTKNFLIEVAAVIVEVHDVQVEGYVDMSITPRIVGKFSTYIKSDPALVWEERCVKEFWEKNPEQYECAKAGIISDDALSLEDAARKLVDFVACHGCNDDNAVVVFDTASYDGAWIDHMLGSIGKSSNYLLGGYNTTRDLSSFCLGVSRIPPSENPGNSKNAAAAVLKKYGFEWLKWGVEHDHKAVNDAATIALDFAHISSFLSVKRHKMN